MRPDEWLACDDPRALLTEVVGPAEPNATAPARLVRAAHRRLRLLAVHALGPSLREFPFMFYLRALRAVTLLAEGEQPDPSDTNFVREHGAYMRYEGTVARESRVNDILEYLLHDPAVSLKWLLTSIDPASDPLTPAELAACCPLLREIFGERGALLEEPEWRAEWRTDTVLALARQMYDSEQFGAMPILADALQDAGCDNAKLLAHCRDPMATHVRGCWVLDTVLGKV